MRYLLISFLLPFITQAQINPAFIVKSNLGYTQLESSGEGLFGFEKDGKIGYMDKNEKVVIPAIYSFESETIKVIPSFTKGYVRLKKDGKYGVLDKTGKITIPFEYDNLNIYTLLRNNASFSSKDGGKTLYGMVTLQNQPVLPAEYEQFVGDSNMIVLKQNGKYGLADPTGKILIPAEFYSLAAFPAGGVLLAEKDGKYGIIDAKGNWLFEKQKSVYTLLGASQGMVRCKVNDKYGFLDMKGNEVIITRYDEAADFNNMGLAKIGQKKTSPAYTSQYGYIDKSGNEVIPVKYDYLSGFSQGLAMAKDPETNRYGFLDKTGKWVIKPIYLDGLSFDDFGGAWLKMTDAKYHYIDKTGKDYGTVDSTSYRNFSKDGFAIMANTEYPYVLIDKTGNVIKKIDDCDGIYNFSEGMAGYKCKGVSQYGFLDWNGNHVLPCDFTGFDGFLNGIAKVYKNVSGKSKAGYIKNDGSIVLPIVYDTVMAFRDGWGLIKKDGNYFFVDKNGNLKDPPRKYDNLLEFRSGYSLGIINGKDGQPNTYYYINTRLKEEFNITALQAYLFWDDAAIVKRNKVYEMMNKKGEVYKSLDSVDQLKFCTEGLMAIRQNGKWGFMDLKGNITIPARYDSCDQFKYGYARIKKANKWGIADKNGNEIFEPKYENIFPCENAIFIFYDKGWGVMDKSGKILVPPNIYSVTLFEKDRALARLGKSYTIIKSPLVK